LKRSWLIRVSCVTCLCFVLLTSFSSADDKRYPPYPDVWGYALPWLKPNRASTVKMYRMSNGDFALTYRQDENPTSDYIGRLFFSGNELSLTKQAHDELAKIAKRTGQNRIVLKDGQAVQFSAYKECDNEFSDPFFFKTDSSGRVVSKKMLFYYHDKPIRVPLADLYDLRKCAGSGELSMIIDNTGRLFEPLDDGGFLFFNSYGGFVLRFDKNLNTKSELLNRQVFLIDRDFYMKNFYGKQKLGNTAEGYQALHDALVKYFRSVQKEAPRK
jgi:hypothetical protein